MAHRQSNLGSAAIALAWAACLSASVHAAPFNGFNDRFNLGQSASSGAVCQAARNFDDPLLGDGRKAWDVTCRGWSQKLGEIYVFERLKTADQASGWRKSLSAKADCPEAAADKSGLQTRTCKLKAGGLDYVVLSTTGRHGAVVAEGSAAIADVLTTAAKFAAGSIAEPAAIAEQTASVSQVTSAQIGALAAASQGSASPEALRRQAYERSVQWRFDDAEAGFSQIAAQASSGSEEARIEALNNFALNVSNKQRFAEADIYFKQADEALAAPGASSELKALEANYKAIHARNQGHYEEAIRLAESAMAQRAQTDRGGVLAIGSDGQANITEVSASDLDIRLGASDKDAIRDVQALDIKGTSLEQLGRAQDARTILLQAAAILDRPLFGQGDQAKGLHLSDAAPWLDTTVRADLLRLDRSLGRAADAVPAFRATVTAFGVKHPDSLPLAGLLIELARAESAAGQEDRALTDYEAAFDIFRRERGSLDASADLVGNYFDILLSRIDKAANGGAHEKEQFFTAAQTLVAQSSAEAAKRQAARLMSGDTVAAGLARALDDTNREILAKGTAIRDLQQQGAYQGQAKIAIDAELKTLTDQSAQLEQRLLQADPRYASSLRSSVPLAELQKALQPGEVYLKSFLLANRGYGVLVTSTSVKPYAIDLNRAGAQKLVDDFRRPIDGIQTASGNRLLGRFEVALSRKAFLSLFAPVQDDLIRASNIIYEPDSTLIGAPIAAMVIDDASVDLMAGRLAKARTSGVPVTYEGVAWLGARVSSSIALSPIAFVQARAAGVSKADRPFIAFANPIISKDDPRAFAHVKAVNPLQSATDYCEKYRDGLHKLPPLQDTETEVRVIAKTFGNDPSPLLLQAAFTDTGVMQRGSPSGDLTHYKIVYFATHGILPPPDGCLNAALVTSLGDGESDGLLDVNKIQNLRLDADLVVLSACDTGRSGGGNSDALGGLVQTFVQAGARNLLVSNWSVDSAATEQLMTTMFKAAGKSQSEALVGAERALMDIPRYSHPYYWASFVVVGDGARALPSF